MVLVDTSVWIRFFMRREPWVFELDALLAASLVAGHDLVYGEILAGDSGGRARFLANYDLIRRLPTIPHHEVAAFVRSRRLQGRGAGWIDIHLLASAIAGNVKFWTADNAATALADELGILYKSPNAKPGPYLLPK